MADAYAEHSLEWRRLKMSGRSSHSWRMLATQRSAYAFAFEAGIGVRMIVLPSLAKTLTKARPNLLSQSWIR